MQAYCMKCRAKKEMKDAKSITRKMVNRQPKVSVLRVLLRCSGLGKARNYIKRYLNPERGWVFCHRQPASFLPVKQL